ncbi:ABC transporter ATP-binding protein [Paenibacillus sp. BC26]|uniref:ABC transporter ATP-binding protein n=1 Tax=Paenibacillus sp. BC26 TaxID=1881032 RepID=UPI0008E04168|nr:sn-glycerol-3-phosphate ABC transporter ATP-binding protein UgpC [Paenibacillus sp. BC26]SFT00217.1 multiple sugar transport system ATP-binding protein [Paenibacillus sp. BC26]
MAQVLFNHISKRYPGEGRKSVDDFHLEVADGEFLVLVGPSGCGKSTLLRMLAGLEEITEGEMYIGDRMINYVSSKDRDIAMVFQNYALYPHMTVFENIAFGLRLRKLPHHVIEERVARAAKVLEIEAHLHKQPRQMSGGQRQRVALGRAMVREPEVFLMDEPLSNLDAKLRVQMREELTKLHRQLKKTTIYVTHDQIEAMTMGTRIVVMKQGLIQQVATPEDIYSHPANMFVASFIGTPPMNFIHGHIRKWDSKTYFDTKRYSLEIPADKAAQIRSEHYVDKKIVMGVRAETMAVLRDGADMESYKGRSLSAAIEIRELLGSDAYLHLNNEDHKLVVRVEPRRRFSEGDTVTVAFDMEQIHFFDPQTEEALC